MHFFHILDYCSMCTTTLDVRQIHSSKKQAIRKYIFCLKVSLYYVNTMDRRMYLSVLKSEHKKNVFTLHCKTFVQRHQLQSRKYLLKKLIGLEDIFFSTLNSIFRFRRDVIVCFYHSNTKFISNVFLYTYSTYISCT